MNRQGRRIRGGTVVIVMALGALGALPGSAFAGAVSSNGSSSITFTAAAGETNNVTIDEAGMVPNTFDVKDTGTAPAPAPMTPQCIQSAMDTVTCTLTGPLTMLTINLDDMNDSATTAPLEAMLTPTTTMNGGLGTDTLTGSAGADTFNGGPGGAAPLDDDTFIGGTGTDTVTYATRSFAIVADPDDTAADDDGEGTCPGASCEGDDIRSDVENITGGAAGDTLNGTTSASTNNRLDGGPGADILDGKAGSDTLLGGLDLDDDTINGGTGTADTASYAGASQVTANLRTGTATGNGTDTLQNIDNLTGSSNNDTLISDGNNNVLDGGAGTGSDTASYEDTTGAVQVDLSRTDQQNTGGAGGDTLTSIENVTGGLGNDTLTSSFGANAGANVINGGPGNSDTASFAYETTAVTANLRTSPGTPTTGAGGDTLSNIENLTGGTGNDTLVGDGNNNSLNGVSGTDTVSFEGGPGVTADLRNGIANGDGMDSLSNIDNLIGSGNNDTLVSDANNNTLNGGSGGSDTASFAGASVGVTADLRDTMGDNASGDGTDTMVNIDNLTGGSGSDTLGSDGNDNVLNGGAGGNDTASFAGAAAGVTASTSSATGDANLADTLTNIDNLTGTAQSDTLISDGNDNVLNGGTGAPLDTVSYATAAAGVTASLRVVGAQNTGGAGTDTLTGIENLTGSSHNDTLGSGTTANVLDGGAGGIDTASFDGATAGITADLAAGTATGEAGTDMLVGMENLTGGTGADTLDGSNNDNVIDGGMGIDVLRGKFGDDKLIGGDGADSNINGGPDNDTLMGGSGNDSLSGDTGNDTASYENAAAGVTASLEAGSTTNDGDGMGADTLTDVENLKGSGFADTLTGKSGQTNVLTGLAADDTLNVRSTPPDGDTANCGLGSADIVIADAAGDTIIDCERIDYPGAPDTMLLTGPPNPTNDNTPQFTFDSTEPGSTFQCRVDAGVFTLCTSPHITAMLADGSRTFEVRAIDPVAGDDMPNPDTDASPASQTFIVDTTPPNTSITAGPSGATSDNPATFTFTSTEGGSTFTCRVDSDPFVACNSGTYITSTLADGPHTFEVKAADGLGNVDATPASRAFTVDTGTPDTTITSGPSGTTTSNTGSFTFTSTEGGSTFQCSLDGAAFSACTSPTNFGPLANGAHTFSVRATDAVGNVDASPASQAFTVSARTGQRAAALKKCKKKKTKKARKACRKRAQLLPV